MTLDLNYRPDEFSEEVWSALRALVEFRTGSDDLIGALQLLGRISASQVEILLDGEIARVMGLAADFDEFAGPLIDRLGKRDGQVASHCAWTKLAEGRLPGETATYIEKEYRKRQKLQAEKIYISTSMATNIETVETLVERALELYCPTRIEIRCAVASHEVKEARFAGVEVITDALLILPQYRAGHHQNAFGNMLCRLPEMRQRSTFMPTYIRNLALPGIQPTL
ncbi:MULTISPECIES: hypothetical protein [Rhizobium]|uniref:Uncharacterized protein n=1 Tax=Rhizobium tropici TaxID=398 RepID=A0A329YGM7_RHITR|nr:MULTISPECIES: hypothetical protein [Rhizobium]MBX4913685.1 hypothetical protein [Rhizobium bangladeshense]RAX42526.1 hypothetical protein DQ393_06870 [Rhizobium tropici]